MKLSDRLEQAFNDQITLELGASTVYRQLAVEMDVRGLPGAAAWLRHQADEEILHGNKLIDHLVGRGNHPRIGAVAAPDLTIESVQQCFETALAHEQKVSSSIRELHRAAEAEDDQDSRPLLDWFLEEQVEEEETVQGIIDRIVPIADDGPGLLGLDAELAERPTASTENQD